MLSLSVTLKVKSDKVDEFLHGMSENQASALRDETGCLHFDIARNVDEPTLFHLYEVYDDTAALEAHRSSPHYLKWLTVAGDVLEEGGRVMNLGEILAAGPEKDEGSLS